MTTMRSGLAIALRTVVAAALVVVFAAAIVRAAAATFDPFQPYPGHTADYGFDRPRAIRAALPEIANRPEDVVLVLGSSAVARAFVPSSFDAVLDRGGRHYVSFNLAQVLLQPETVLAMAKNIRSTFEAQNKRIAISIVGISVPELSQNALRAARRRMPDQAFAFASPEVLRSRAHRDPLGALGDGAELLLFGNVRPERVGLWIEDGLSAHPLGCDSGMKQPPDGADAEVALEDYCEELRRQFPRGVPPWDRSTRGALDFGLPATRPMLERLVDLQTNPISPPAAVPQDPVLVEVIDESAVRMLVEAMREIEAVSDTTFLLRDILNPALIAPRPPAEIAEWREVAERIARESDARLLDLNDGTVASSDFGDRTHLNPLAAERFSSILATRVRPMVQEKHAAR